MKRIQSIQHQIVLLLAVILIILEALNVFTQYKINYTYVFNDVFHDGDMLARNAAMELENYTLIDWLADYWEEHEKDMVLPYDDKSFGEMEMELRRQLPVATELTELDEAVLLEDFLELLEFIAYVLLCGVLRLLGPLMVESVEHATIKAKTRHKAKKIVFFMGFLSVRMLRFRKSQTVWCCR